MRFSTIGLSLLRWLLRLCYRFRAYNVEVLKTAGPVLLLPNHVSWWDWLFLGVCLEEDWRFVTSSETARLSRLHRFIMVNRRTFPVDIHSPYAVKHMAEYLQQGGRLVLFPEGRISTTGSLMKLFEGTGFLIHKTQPKVITAYLRGAVNLPLSRSPGAKRWFPKVTAHFSDPLPFPHVGHLSATAERHLLTDWAQDRMVEQQFRVEMEFGPRTVPAAIFEAARFAPGRIVLEDFSLQRLTYGRLLLGAKLLAQQWRRRLGEASRVGVLLPNVNAMPVVLLSLWSAEKVPAILNYTLGLNSLLSCVRLAGVKEILTSRKFLAQIKLTPNALEAAGVRVLFVEDIRAGISAGDKFKAWLGSQFSLPRITNSAQATGDAVILFTSGSEGEPKGVALTHQNLLANIRQMLSVVDLTEHDRFFNALPLFHSFGLTVGLLLPLVRGVFVLVYLSPLHYRVVPAAFYNLDCTVLFGTNTFLAGYARKAHPYDFHTLRYVFAGAEKLQDATSLLWMQKFGIRILEGYGATECSPCVAANVPMHARSGSAGRFLPAIEYRLEPVEGISVEAAARASHPASMISATTPSPAAGRLFVRGPNVMRGYLNPEANAKFQALGGWYDTGDIVRVESEGWVFVLGRLKRFAKISGEMVSLTAIEEALAGAFPQYGPRFVCAVVSQPDESKGERLVLVSNEAKLTLDEVRQALRAHGLSNLAVPRELRVLREIPLLGTGKVNHRALQEMIRAT